MAGCPQLGFATPGSRVPALATTVRSRAAVGKPGNRLLSRTARSGGVAVRSAFRNIVWVMVAGWLLTLPAAGQLEIGGTTNRLNGTVSGGYTGDFGNEMSSDHSMTFGGSGTLSGSYYNPNFISYTISPYLNQGRANSSFQSITDASGVNATANIFAGSKFPGSINYSKSYNSEGNYSIPGAANYTTKGDSDGFGISWSELLQDWPSLSAVFQTTSNSYSIFGTNDNGSSNSKSISLRSSYLLRGFNMSGFFSDGDSSSEVPQILEGSSQSLTSTSDSRGYGFSVGHPLPLRGGFSATATRSDVGTNFAGYSYHGTIDTYTGSASFQPTNKFHFSVGSNYSDNLSGSLYQAVTSAGGLVTPPAQGSSNSFDLDGNASYSVMANMQVLASADRRQQTYLGQSYSADAYGGGISYWRLVWRGNFNVAASVTENTSSTSSAKELGFSTTVSYNKRFSDGWQAGVFGSYSQNVQTLLITYMSSFYSYGASVRRRWTKFGWTAGANFASTGLSEQAGTTNSSQSYNSSVNYTNWIAVSGSFSKSNGNGIQTGAGLAATPTPQPVLNPTDLIIFNGNSFSFGLSSNPQRRLTLAATFAKSNSDSSILGMLSSNGMSQYNALFQYQVRKMSLNGGYSRLEQNFSTSTAPPARISSFYIGVSRWFNFF